MSALGNALGGYSDIFESRKSRIPIIPLKTDYGMKTHAIVDIPVRDSGQESGGTGNQDVAVLSELEDQNNDD